MSNSYVQKQQKQLNKQTNKQTNRNNKQIKKYD